MAKGPILPEPVSKFMRKLFRRKDTAADYLIAAAAAQRSAAVLHYDRHFDTLCRVLGIESVWIAPSGSID